MISENAVVMDFCRPIAVFEATNIPSRGVASFELHTVAASTDSVRVTGGLTVVPQYTSENAPGDPDPRTARQRCNGGVDQGASEKRRLDDVGLHRGVPLSEDRVARRKNGDHTSRVVWTLGMNMKDIRLKRG